MICLSVSAITVLMEDGAKKHFDSEELQNRLTCACRSVGMKDFWLAEDMTNAVENALRYQSENGVIFTEEEINLFVDKMLEQSGYNEVAVKFRLARNGKHGGDFLSSEVLNKYLKANLNLNEEESALTVKKVLTSFGLLEIKNPPANLILELAKYYKNTLHDLKKISSSRKKIVQSSVLILQKREILPLLSVKTNELIAYGIIDISGVSTLFPSIKIELKFDLLSRYYKLEGVLTELLFFPCFDIVSDAIDEIIRVVKNKLLGYKEISGEIPVFLRFSDIYSFCRNSFGVQLPEGENFCKELSYSFIETLKYPVQIKGLKSK